MKRALTSWVPCVSAQRTFGQGSGSLGVSGTAGIGVEIVLTEHVRIFGLIEEFRNRVLARCQ